MIHREAEWDEDEVAKLFELKLYDAGVCRCGHHRDLTNDPDANFKIEVERCDACATVAKFLRRQDVEDAAALKALGDPSKVPADTPRPSDGRHVELRFVGTGTTDPNPTSAARR